MSSSDWRALGDADPHSLSETRLQAHYAVQWLARTARAFIAAKPDDSHISFGWDDGLDGFSTDALPNGTRLGLSITTLTLVLLDAGRGGHRQSLTLLGHRDKDARAWLGAQVQAMSLDPGALDAPSPWDMPTHPIGAGAAYDTSELADARKTLAAWFANANLSLGRIGSDYAARLLAVSPVRCWPHHFDIATLISLEAGDPEHARSVNVGLSPGDDCYDEPYFYVSPWPCPEAGKLPPLPSLGHWHTQGFLAAVVPASRIADQARPQRAAEEFLQTAVGAAMSALR